jgi:hypothetical protein
MNLQVSEDWVKKSLHLVQKEMKDTFKMKIKEKQKILRIKVKKGVDVSSVGKYLDDMLKEWVAKEEKQENKI